MKITVRKVVFPALNQVACESHDEDLNVRDKDALIRARYTCVSAGTELAKLTGLQQVKYPFVPGNRAIGRVIETGARVRGVKAGDLVFTYLAHVSHGAEERFVPLPEELDRPDGALIGMALVALAGVRVARPELGDWAVVTGAGLVGALAAQLLQLSGARVILIDRSAGRLAVARECGIEHLVDSSAADPRAAAMALTGGAGAELALECSGAPQLLLLCTELMATGGRVVLTGSPRAALQTDLTPLLQRVHLRRPHGDLSLHGAHEWKLPFQSDGFVSHSQTRNARILARLMADGRLKTRPLLSKVFRPEQAAEAYRVLREEPDTHPGVVFDWS